MKIRGSGVSAVVTGLLAAGGASAQMPDGSSWNQEQLQRERAETEKATPARP